MRKEKKNKLQVYCDNKLVDAKQKTININITCAVTRMTLHIEKKG